MIFHINRVTDRDDLSEEQRQSGLEMLHQAPLFLRLASAPP